MKRSILTLSALMLVAWACQAQAAGEKLYGVHWWDYSNPTVGSGPDGGWSVETVITNSAAWWQAPFFTPLYQGLTANHNAAIITRVDYDWGQTVPAPGTISAAAWATKVVNEVVSPLGPYATRWVIGNEPNIIGEGNGWASNQVTPAGYAQIYTAVRQAIKAVRPQDEVLFAPVSPGSVIAGVRWKDGNQWLGEAIDATLALPGGAIDGFALHAYGGQGTAGGSVVEFQNTFASQLAVIDGRSLKHATTYITEWNRATSTTGNFAANEQVTADFITQSLIALDSWNRTPGNHNVRALAWFIQNKDYGPDWNQYSLEWWQTQGNPAGSSGDMYTALMNRSGLSAGMVGTRPNADYNADGVVTSGDYSAWRAAFGGNTPFADGSKNGRIDAADYVLWRKSMSQSAAPAAVPEPVTLAGLVFATTLVAMFRCRFNCTMRIRLLTTCLTAFLTCTAATIGFAADESDHAPATILIEGKIWTADANRPWAEAVALRDEKILAVGSREELAKYRGDETQSVNAGDGMVVPGLFDSHIHLIDGGQRLAAVQLRDSKSKEEFVRRIADYAKTQKPGVWIDGGDWDHTLWGGELPSRDWIDAVTPDNPVWINRLDGHMSLANSAAMKAAGVGDDVKDVRGGEIVRDKSGRPTGIFKDNAMSLIGRAQPNATTQQRLDATVAAMDYLAARGVTSVHQMGEWSDVEILRLAERRGLMKTRVYACTPLWNWERLAGEVKEHGRGSDWLSIGGLKGYVDGSLGSHTAAFLEPFSDKPGDRGLLVNTEENLEKWTLGADGAGLQVVVHAIGDRAIRTQLDVYERVEQANGPRDRRFRIEHSQHIAPDDISRFAKLQVIASMQPYHAIDDGRWADGVIGAKRCETTYAFRSLLDTSARLAFGSDWFVAPPTPMEGIYAAVTRRTLDGKNPEGWVPQQKITVEEALKAYTIDAAYSGFSEKKLGSIEAGKLADIVVLGGNLFETPPNELDKVPIRMTIVGGKVVYDATSGISERK